jgi:hypothetical protein
MSATASADESGVLVTTTLRLAAETGDYADVGEFFENAAVETRQAGRHGRPHGLGRLRLVRGFPKLVDGVFGFQRGDRRTVDRSQYDDFGLHVTFLPLAPPVDESAACLTTASVTAGTPAAPRPSFSRQIERAQHRM